MLDTALMTLFLVLCLLGYVFAIHLSSWWYRAPNPLKYYRFFKFGFLPVQIAALLLALLLMDVERNLIPIIGFIVLIFANSYAAILVIGGLDLSRKERNFWDKKLLKCSLRILCSTAILFAVWIIVWWDSLYG